jgi:hypothetical protein
MTTINFGKYRRLCHNVDTPTRARQASILRIKTLSNETFRKFEKISEDLHKKFYREMSSKATF